MNRSIKILLLVVIATLACCLAWQNLKDPAKRNATITSSSTETPPEDLPGPFTGLGLRFDGHYRYDIGDVRYLVRFFPEGRVVLINGTKEVENTLADFLTRETKGNPSMGLYNVMADVRGDSIFFLTRPEKGEISYRGKVQDASTVHFIRHSHITGKVFDFEYLFHPDKAVLSE